MGRDSNIVRLTSQVYRFDRELTIELVIADLAFDKSLVSLFYLAKFHYRL